MIITHLLKHFKVDLSGENVVAPAIVIDRTLLKRMQAGTRTNAQPSQVHPSQQFPSGSFSSSADLYSAIMN